ncbi:patatin-like phospholipase domain-containing protein [Pseudomonas huanghezhanensis]|uniref:patatin-like phospholipase family protein n=1 Tax=Pseudomonas huanghezhanensis TaxID=3002903 RepID=UPI002285EB89|nr:patatin-like phospholipase family protein [Pseudomonas sp. BSw22131]
MTTPNTPHASGTTPPSDLKFLFEERRKKLPPDVRASLSARPWGLALSGGGIRSATFCFGLIKALAEKGLLHRIDLLSTVSGGGYIGSTLGKLFHNEGKTGAPDPMKLEKDIASAQARWFALWLRANGRYLIPRGLQDLLLAIANFGRNLLGVHVELALMSLILAGLLLCIDLGVWGWADCLAPGGGCDGPQWLDLTVIDFFSNWPTVWMALIPVAWVAAILSCTYWAMPTGKRRFLAMQRACTALMAGLGIVILLRHSTSTLAFLPDFTGTLILPGGWVALAIALMGAWILGIGLASVLTFKSGSDPDRIRNRLTHALALMLKLSLGVVLLGIIDFLAWMLANVNTVVQGQLGGTLAVIAVALRATVPMISDLPKSLIPGTRRVVMEIINLAGVVITFMLVVFWVSVVHRAATVVLFDTSVAGLQFGSAWQSVGWLCIAPLLMVLVSAGNRDFLNRSSLYAFYRARLIRSYLGAANPGRFPSAPGQQSSCTGKAVSQTLPLRVSQVDSGDDLAMSDYRPDQGGGPVHLINVCVNQTSDALGGLFNQDRKGTLLTVRSDGCVSQAENVWHPGCPENSLSLGAWVAISGAAVAPGLGASTRSGIAALLTIAGIRLGYWWDSAGIGGKSKVSRIGKYGQLWSELRGRFSGDQRQDWFLSDGGHFENTASYALLREECEVIVVADCGADPRYAFGDLENLVRKARIDLQVEITFLRPKHADPRLPTAFGSLNELGSADSQACLALARVDYGRTRRKGHMIIVKPNMCHGASVDLVNFKADNPLFPQEPTTDQSFSEAQWESYFQLGQTLGCNIELKQLKDICAFAQDHFVDDDGAIRVTKEDGSVGLRFSSKRISSRIASTGAVSASISLGAIASVGLAGWQMINSEMTQQTSQKKIEPTAFRQLTSIFARLPPAGPGADPNMDGPLGEMATELWRVGEQVCTKRNIDAFLGSRQMRFMVEKTREACSESPSPHPSCAVLLGDDAPECLQTSPRPVCEPTYWIRDWSVKPLSASNCWPVGRVSTITETTDWASSAPMPAPAPVSVEESIDEPNAGFSAAPQAAAPVCEGQTVYLQIYGPQLRDYSRSLRGPWREELRASVPPIEDVQDTARRANRRAPTPYPVPTIIYHTADSLACANALRSNGGSTQWNVVPLAEGLKPQKNVIEVWLPPSTQVQ